MFFVQVISVTKLLKIFVWEIKGDFSVGFLKTFSSLFEGYEALLGLKAKRVGVLRRGGSTLECILGC